MSVITGSTVHMRLRPVVAPPLFRAAIHGGQEAYFQTSTGIEYTADITFSDDKQRPGIGWQVGFIQAQYVETNWGYYKGLKAADGSIFVQRGRPPARPQQSCCDSLAPNAPFQMTGNPRPSQQPSTGGPLLPLIGTHAGGGAGATITILGFDGPSDSYDLLMRNTSTNKPNYLSEAEFEFLFCTALVARSTVNDTVFLKHFYWNVRWQAKFGPPTAGTAIPVLRPAGKGNGSGVGAIADGEPRDGRFITMMKYLQSTNCNTIFAAAKADRRNARYSATWTSVDVRR